MKICPDCHKHLVVDSQACQSCSWTLDTMEGLPIYLSTKDKADTLFDSYLDNYNKISLDDLEESIQHEKYLASQNKKLFSYIPDVEGLDVCEIGVGKGLLLQQLIAGKPASLTGIDISLPYLNVIGSTLGHDVNLIVANAENLPYTNEFDIIIAADIIEHVFNVGDFLTSVNRALKPNGRFIVKTPNNEDLNGYSTLRGCKYDFVHLRNFNKQTLSTVLHGAGFEVQKVIFDGFYPSKKRHYIKNSTFLSRKFDNFINKKFDTVHDANAMSNFLCKLFMIPIEITACATKKLEISLPSV